MAQAGSTYRPASSPDSFLPFLISSFIDKLGAQTTTSQEDAMEFLTFILDGLHEELLAVDQGQDQCFRWDIYHH